MASASNHLRLRTARTQLPKLKIQTPSLDSANADFPSPPPTPSPENANKKLYLQLSADAKMHGKEASPGALLIRRLTKDACLPERSTSGSIGYDLAAAESKLVPAYGRCVVDVGITIRLPRGTYGRIASRSGLAAFHGISTGAGVIDPDYTGRLSVVLFNHSPSDFLVRKGARIAQLILERAVIVPVKDGGDLMLQTPSSSGPQSENGGCLSDERGEEEKSKDDPVERGASGFGSSGVY